MRELPLPGQLQVRQSLTLPRLSRGHSVAQIEVGPHELRAFRSERSLRGSCSIRCQSVTHRNSAGHARFNTGAVPEGQEAR